MELAAIFTATPADIDTELAKLQDRMGGIFAAIRRQNEIMNYSATSTDEFDKAYETVQDLDLNLRVLRSFVSTLEMEHTRRGGWDRVYAVNNSNGHFHRSTQCQNTYATTEWVWMPQLSGLTNAEVVERTGKMSCLTCFADQREEIEKGREATVFTPAQQKTREERAEAAAKKAAKAAATAAKAITNPDGTPLLDRVNSVIKTERAAWIEAVDNLEWAEYSEYMIKVAPQHLEGEKLERNIASNKEYIQEHYETTLIIAKALAHKTGRDLADVLNEISTKADKKIKANRKSRAVEEARLNG